MEYMQAEIKDEEWWESSI